MSKPSTLRDVDETELYLNHGGNSVWSRWWKVGGGFFVFATWLFTEAGPETHLYLRRHPWMLAFGLLSFGALLYAETLRYDLPNHYMKDGLQYFDQAAIGKRRLQRRLLRLPALLFAIYAAYVFIPWMNYQEILTTDLKYWLLLPAAGVLVYLYYVGKGYYAAFEAKFVAETYGDLTARFDQKTYAPGDAVNVTIGHNRVRADRMAMYDIVVQKVFEHQYTKTTGSGKNRKTRTYHERKVHYTRSFQIRGSELNDGWCFDLPEHIGGHSMDTDMRDVKKLHYWELLLDKQDSALWGRFFIMVEGGPQAKHITGTEWMPAMPESVYDEGEGYKESVFGDSPEAISISRKDDWPMLLAGLFFLIFAVALTFISMKGYSTPGRENLLPVLIPAALAGLFYLPICYAVYLLVKPRPRPGKVQRRTGWMAAGWRIIVAAGLVPALVLLGYLIWTGIQAWLYDDSLRISEIVGAAFGLIVFGSAMSYAFYRAVAAAARKVNQARRAGMMTATFSAEIYAPGADVLVRVAGKPEIDPVAEITLNLRLVDEFLRAKRGKRFVLFNRRWKVTGGKLGDGVRFTLPAKVKGYHVQSEYRGFSRPKYWELGVDFGEGLFHQFIVDVAGRPVEVGPSSFREGARPPVQSEEVKAKPKTDLDWFA